MIKLRGQHLVNQCLPCLCAVLVKISVGSSFTRIILLIVVFLFCGRQSSIAIGSVHKQEQLNELIKLQFNFFQKIKSMWFTFSLWLFNALLRGISAWVIYGQVDEKSIFAWSLELGASWVHFSASKSDVGSKKLDHKSPGPRIGVWFEN